ncbi:MAG: class I SAM-dependent methyltransferase [Solirubrobacteraceae bacterium]
MTHLDEQRLAFGPMAELYDRARPSYPAGAIDDVIAHAGLRESDPVLEIGAGTGKATVLLAGRGLRVLALEPSAEMAAVARINCAAYPRVCVVEQEFESWQASEPVRAVLSAAAWHWISPDVRYPRAHRALIRGGTLAALWTFPDWEACALRDGLRDAYRAVVPGLTSDFPMHPASRPTRLAGDWRAEIEASAGFENPQVRIHPWCGDYTGLEYTRLLQTHQDHIRLPSDDRERLLVAIADVINAAGGTVTMPFETRVCLATRR